MTLQVFANTPDDAVGSDGDFALQLSNRAIIGPKASNTWGSSNYYALQGPGGLPITSGLGNPSASVGSIGQVYLDASKGALWGPKTASGWGSSASGSIVGPTGAAGSRFIFGDDPPGLELADIGALFFRRTTFDLYYKITNAAGAVTASYPNGWQIIGNLTGKVGAKGDTGSSGATIRNGSGAPSSGTTANDGDYYFDTVGKIFYGPRASGSWPSSGTSLQGPKGDIGASGLSVLSGSADPTNTDGVVGQPAFINVASGKLFGAKTASGWPSGLSLVGAQGPASPGLRSGAGLPSSSNPSYQVDGDYYLRNDVSPALLYGPRANGVWPTNAQNTGGSQTQFGSGAPASTLGAQGDVYYDLQNALFYPPKQAGGWTLTPINMVGPTGAPGPTASYRNVLRGSYWSGGSSGPTAGTAIPVLMPIIANAANTTYGVPLTEPMFSSGSLTALTATTTGGVGTGTWTFNVLKNGSIVYTATSFISCGSAAASAYRVLPTNGLTFAVGDLITMTASSSTSNSNQTFNVNLFYTTNS